MLLSALAAIALAAATPTVRDAPWGLTGISEDGRTLHLFYQGGGCLENDGQAQVDTSDPEAVRITVRQTTHAEDGLACPLYLSYVPLDVDLGAPLAGRFVTGGPDGGAVVRPEEMPNVIGLRRKDAVAALKRQSIKTDVGGRKVGVITLQAPAAGKPVPRRDVGLVSGPFDPRARLSIVIRKQSVEAVLRDGLRYLFDVDPAAEKFIEGDVECNGEDGGNDARITRRPGGSTAVRISNGNLRRAMRRRTTSTCRLSVASYPTKPRGRLDFLRLRTATVTLKHR